MFHAKDCAKRGTYTCEYIMMRALMGEGSHHDSQKVKNNNHDSRKSSIFISQNDRSRYENSIFITDHEMKKNLITKNKINPSMAG